MAAPCKTEAGLLLRTACENRREIIPIRNPHRLRNISPAAPQKIFLPVQNAAEGIITAGLNIPVVKKKSVRNAVQSSNCLFILIEDGRIK